MIYLDHAATSFPKPERVIRAVERCLREVAGSPARGGHVGVLDANRIVFATRERAARLLGVGDAARVVLTSGATLAINLALAGTLAPGDHVLTTDMEHNAVARPLARLRRLGVEVGVAPHLADGRLFVAELDRHARSTTRWVVVNHASNVDGRALDLAAIADWCAARGTRLGVDAAQSAGYLPLDVDRLGIGWLACSGHKGLWGPQGTGLLAVGNGVRIDPVLAGGTGSKSESEEQPRELPDALESGTPNTPGIAGLGEALAFVAEQGIATLHERAQPLARMLERRLRAIGGVDVWGPGDAANAVPVVSFVIRDADPVLVAARLEDDWGIRVRVGLHCAPAAHRRLGTFPSGTLRASPGPLTTEREIDALASAVAEIAHSA